MRPRKTPDSQDTKPKLLDAAERLMLEKGYAAVRSRPVALLAGVTPAVVHYYFPSLDDLFIALYHRAHNSFVEKLTVTLAAEDPLLAMWELNQRSIPSSLAAELMAVANHRTALQIELDRGLDQIRQLETKALERILSRYDVDPQVCPPLGIAVLISAVGRSLASEENVGITNGHAEARTVVDFLLSHLGRRPEVEAQSSAPRRRPASAGRTQE